MIDFSDWALIDNSSKYLKLNRLRYLKHRRQQIDDDTSSSDESENQEPEINMTYQGHILDEALFDTLYNSRFYSLARISDFSDKLIRTDFSVVESRRTAHNALNEFVQSGQPGSSLFNDDNNAAMRFPANREPNRVDVYVSDSESNFENLLISLANVLSYRNTNQAKDTGAAIASGSTGTSKSEKIEVANDAAGQDNAKRFEELCKQFRLYARFGPASYNRRTFETKVARWM